MVWNAAGTFHTRLSATALTANREFVFPDQNGTFVVSSAGVIEATALATNLIRVSAGTVLSIQSSASAVDAGIELFGGRTTAGATYVDFHTTNVDVDFNARIIRGAGPSGNLDFNTTGSAAGVDTGMQFFINSARKMFIVAAGVGIDTDLVVGGNFSVSGNVTLNGRLSASAGNVTGIFSANTIIANQIGILNTLTVSSAAVINALAVGGTLTVSGTTVLADVTVAGRISASAGNVIGTLSAGRLDIASAGIILLHRQNGVSEGGEIQWTRAADDATQWAMDCIGAGSATANIDMRLFNAQAGVPLFSWSLLGNFSAVGQINCGTLNVSGGAAILGILSASATAVFSGSILMGTAAAAPYNNQGSIMAPIAAAAKFRNTCKAWVQFSIAAGSPTLNTQFNVSGVTRASSGVYAVNLTTAAFGTSFPFVSVTISGTAGTSVHAGGLTSTQSFGIRTTVGAVATDASAVAAGGWDQQ